MPVNAEPERVFDRRTVRRYLANGRIDQAELKSYLEALPDATENIREASEGGDDDGYERNQSAATAEANERAAAEAPPPRVEEVSAPAAPVVPPTVDVAPPVAPPVAPSIPEPSAPAVAPPVIPGTGGDEPPKV